MRERWGIWYRRCIHSGHCLNWQDVFEGNIDSAPLIFIFELPVLLKLKGYFATVGWDSPFPAHLLCAVLLKGYFATVGWVSQFPAHLLCELCAVLLITERLFCHCWLRFPIPSSPSVCCSTERLFCHCWLGFPIPSSPTVYRSTERLFCHCWLSLPVPSSPVGCCSTDYWKVILPLLVGFPHFQLT